MFSVHSRLRHAVADTFAMVVYCTVVNMMIEIFLSGMTFEQSLSSRLVAIPVNIIIAVPYGFYRDFAMRQARRISPAGWMKNMADVLAYVTFQSPVYVAILWSVGADWHQIVAAVSSNLAVSMMMALLTATSSTIAAACSAWPPTSRRKPDRRYSSDWPCQSRSHQPAPPRFLNHRINLSTSPAGLRQIVHSENAQAPSVS